MKWFSNLFKKKKKQTTQKEQLSEKEVATQRGEPYVSILSMDIDPNNPHEGAFELDWNDKFLTTLIRHGYQKNKDDTDADIVDRWFVTLCRHVVLETYEQYEAMTPDQHRVIKQKNIGDGFSEAS